MQLTTQYIVKHASILFFILVQELCAMHRLQAGDIVTEWVAFTHSKKNMTMELELLDQFEREVSIRIL